MRNSKKNMEDRGILHLHSFADISHKLTKEFFHGDPLNTTENDISLQAKCILRRVIVSVSSRMGVS